MARANLTKTAMVGPYPTLQPAALSLDLNFQACDASNKNQFTPSADDLILVWNTHATNPYTFTVTSAPDALNRTGDITTYAVAAGVISAFRVKTLGWVQSDGKVYLEGSNASVKFAVVSL